MPVTRSNPRLPRTALQGWLALLWRQPLWAILFALFFGTLYGGGAFTYWLAYKISVVFAYAIGHAIWFTAYFIEPRCRDPLGEDVEPGDWRIGAWYVGMATLGSFVAAILVHFFLFRGFLDNWRSWVASGLYTLLFVALFTGINFARVFYLRAVDRAKAVERARAELAQAELRALRAQIHPHFLFNALNSIAALIAVNPREAEDTTTELAEAFRYALRASERDTVRLGEELEFLRTVLSIERTRFGDRLRVIEEVEPGTEALLVPSLLLQPLVENAVRHGLAPRPQGGTLRIGARRDGALLQLSVEDDGAGMDGVAPARGEGFGLRSVRERLRLAGPPHAIEIESAPGRGTRVRLTLPLVESAAGAPPIPGASS
jgi:sensor histidine kinase YesM